MKKLLRPTTFALLTMALCFTACENGNNSYPKEYLGFEKKAQDFSYQKNTAEATILVYPQKVGTNEYIQLVCRPQNGKSETTQMSIRLVKK